MQPLRAIIADDEELLRSHLKNTLAEIWPDLIICGEAANGIEAKELILSHAPDIAFIDIRMPGLNGLEVAATAPESCQVVFVTAYDQYAIDAFENAAIDYILKPLTVERLEKTMVRLKKRFSEAPELNRSIMAAVENVITELGDRVSPQFLEWIRVQHRDGIKLFPVDEVSFFRASDKYTEVMTSSSEHLIRTSIKQLALQLDPKKFWRIHRKTIINVSKVVHVERSFTGRYVVSLAGRTETLTVSRTYSHLFKQM